MVRKIVRKPYVAICEGCAGLDTCPLFDMVDARREHGFAVDEAARYVARQRGLMGMISYCFLVRGFANDAHKPLFVAPDNSPAGY